MTDPRRLEELGAVIDRLSHGTHPTFGSFEADVLDALCRLVFEAETPEDVYGMAEELVAAAQGLRDQKDSELSE